VSRGFELPCLEINGHADTNGTLVRWKVLEGGENLKTEDLLKLVSFLKIGAKDLVSIMDDVQKLASRVSTIAEDIAEVASLTKDIIQRLEGLAKKVEG
jgi:hypothetical protein